MHKSIERAAVWACLALFAVTAYAAPEGGLRGNVVTVESSGETLATPGAHVRLSGSVHLEALADEVGAYSFANVPPGVYRIDAAAPGLIGMDTVTIEAGKTIELQVRLNVEAVIGAITVNAEADGISATDIATRDTISAAMIDSAPNRHERVESALPLIPGVVRGPDGLINMKGARANQSGALVNGANVSDPVTGAAAIRLPIDVVSSVQVIANPYDPEYGKLTGAVSTVDTRTGNYEGFHATLQNVLPRPRKRSGDFVGIESFTPRATLTGPILKDKLAFTQSLEYRYIRTAIPGLPQLQRDTKLESVDSFSQLDWVINPKQSATVSLAVYPQKLDYLGLGTFTPQASTPDLHQSGYMASVQHRYVTGPESLLVSQLSYKRLDANVTAQSDDPYRLLVDTTQGGYFNRQQRDTYRNEWQETYHFGRFAFLGSHQVKAGFNYAHSSYDGRVQYLPVEIAGASGATIERIGFGSASKFQVDQDETAWFVTDKWAPVARLTIDYGLRFDHDSITESTNAAPRAGVAYALTEDNKTVVKAGAGLFYDRVMLNAPAYPQFPNRVITTAGGSVSYINAFAGPIENPRSTAWNVEIDRQVLERLLVRVGYQQRNTSRDFIVTPRMDADGPVLSVSNGGLNLYREFQVTGRYKFTHHTVNASYVRSKAYGDLNDFNQFFGNTPQVVIERNQSARLPFDAPNRFLAWGEFLAPGRITFSPLVEIHTGFPYSVVNERREYVGARNELRYPGFASVDMQVAKDVTVPLIGRKARAGFSVFNLFNRFNPRETQNNLDSESFGGYYNSVGRTFRGKFVVEF